MNVLAFIRLGRPLFLGGGFILYGLGAAIAAARGFAIDVDRYLLGQAAVTSFQLMTHYANDYFDYDADVANATPTRWSGGSRVLPAGELPRHVALIAARALAAIGSGVTVALAATGAGPLAVPTLALVLALAWSYSAPPLRLCARGLGELATALVVTVLVPWLGWYLQAGTLGGAGPVALTIAPLALLQFAMLIAIELPDAAGDEATGKRTLVVQLGARAAARLYVAATAAAFAWPAVGFALGLPARVALALAAPAPIAMWRITQMARDHADRTRYERLTLFAVFLLVATSGAAVVAWLGA